MSLKGITNKKNNYYDYFQALYRFRAWEYKQYQLDPAHFFTLPSLSWIAALKTTNVQLELFSDIDMAFFSDRALSGIFTIFCLLSDFVTRWYCYGWTASCYCKQHVYEIL